MAQLALQGGAPVIETPPEQCWPIFDTRDEQALLEVFRSGQWWRGGTAEAQAQSRTGQFEKAFADYQGANHALALNSGTTAVEVALRAAGVKAGDEVIVPAISFVVTASACLPLGAYPVFVDVDPYTAQIDPDAIEAAISPRTTAICLVHFGGYPADMDRLPRIARKHNLALIEDCAHAHGSQWRGHGVGTFGEYGTFSFQQFKALTAGEGGLIVTNSLDRWRAAYRFHNLGRLEHKGLYEFHEPASNLRLTDLQGALLHSQMPRFKAQVARRNEACERLDAALNEIEGIEPQPPDERITRRGFYFYVYRYNQEAFKGLPRDRFLEALRAEGVPGVGKGYNRALYDYSLFRELEVPAEHTHCRYEQVDCPVAKRLAEQELCTFTHQTLLLDDAWLDRIAQAVAKIRENVDELIQPSSQPA
ncbi:MAG: DegT/DnrJ/EryC1/StrS family aminotransferase [Phycisphaeraceae bacterium]